MQQGGNYSGGGIYMPPAQPLRPDYGNLYAPAAPSPSPYGSGPPSVPPSLSSYASTAPPSYNSPEMNPYTGPGSYVSSQDPTFPPPDSSYSPSSSYNPNPSQTPYAPAVPSYSPTVPSYDRSYDYAGSTPFASAPPAQPQGYMTGNSIQSYSSGSYGSGLQDYGSGDLHAAPNYGGSTMGIEQVGSAVYGQGDGGGYEQQGGGVYLQGSEYERDGYNGQRESSGVSYDNSPYDSARYTEVYAYDGSQGAEPYGARGTGGSSWNSGGSGAGSFGSFVDSGGSKLARATPKVDTDDTGGGVQKYRVKMLPDMSSSTSKDVICQIGLDGVRMVDPSTKRTLRIYPLDTITRWEVNEPSVFTFWAKSAVDIEHRTIRLQSSSYTTSAILDTITAACVQLSEMLGKDGPSQSSDGNSTESQTQRKSSIVDWVSIRPRVVSEEEKQHWVPDEAATKCSNCDLEFSPFIRRHHCRNCGDLFCDKCTRGRTALTAEEGAQVVRVCDRCLAEVTQRLTNMKEASKAPVQRTHEDLAKKLQEELERNAGKKGTSTSQGNSGSNGNISSGTSVLNCSKCGAISLVPGNSSICPTCGTESSSNQGTGRDRQGSSLGSAARGPAWSSSLPSQNAGPRMKEVACPTCTVHLQVQVPSFGTETVECGVCQHPFLVGAD